MPIIRRINERFFDSWSVESAWSLGWLWSDGNLAEQNGLKKIVFSSNDVEILEKIKSFMNSEHKINWNHLQFSNRYMIRRLESLGLTQRKSLTISMPRELDSAFLRDFIRGYFEGDGSVSYGMSNNKCYISTASIQMKEQLLDIMTQATGEVPRIYTNNRVGWSLGDVFMLRYATVNGVCKFLKWMYHDNMQQCFLERKYAIVRKIFDFYHI